VRFPLASSEARERLVGSLLAGATSGSGSAGARESRGESSTVDPRRHLEGMISEQCPQHEVKRTGVGLAQVSFQPEGFVASRKRI
jgi:hypothetical protein